MVPGWWWFCMAISFSFDFSLSLLNIRDSIDLEWAIMKKNDFKISNKNSDTITTTTTEYYFIIIIGRESANLN